LEHNVQAIRRHVGYPRVDLCCIVKANAYGHGAITVSQFLQTLGVRFFGVATVEEGTELRQNGIDSEILVLFGIPRSQERLASDQNLTVTIHSLEECDRLKQSERPHRAHLYFNSGMNRLGLSETEMESVHRRLNQSNVEITGAFSHFSSSDEAGEAFSRQQLEKFEAATRNRSYPLRHMANSTGLRFREAHFNLVRPGIILYGYNHVPDSLPIDARPVLSWKTKALQIQEVPAGTPISYSRTFVTVRPTRIAALAVGYADGFSRRFSNLGVVVAHGKSCRILGRVTMDLIMVDVTDMDVDLDTEFAVINDQRTAAHLAGEIGTISLEILCRIGPRVPRFYI
jgi:alanine racemase